MEPATRKSGALVSGRTLLVALVLMCITCLGIYAYNNRSDAYSVKALTLKINGVKSSYKIGEEVRINIVRCNKLDEILWINTGDYRDKGNHYYVYRDDGAPVPLTEFGRSGRYWHGPSIDMDDMSPGKCEEDDFVDLNELYQLTAPGRYLVVFAEDIPADFGGGVSRSNTITIEITQ